MGNTICPCYLVAETKQMNENVKATQIFILSILNWLLFFLRCGQISIIEYKVEAL